MTCVCAIFMHRMCGFVHAVWRCARLPGCWGEGCWQKGHIFIAGDGFLLCCACSWSELCLSFASVGLWYSVCV